MPKKIYAGSQDFAELREGGWFYIDKTDFIREWWLGDENGAGKITLILRPRRFGKTLMLSTVQNFFSVDNAGRSDLFEGLDVWKDADMRALQGTRPVIFLSLADVKTADSSEFLSVMNDKLTALYSSFRPLLRPELEEADLQQFRSVDRTMDVGTAKQSLVNLSRYLARHYGKKPIILLDEYDTPMIEAWTKGFWDDAAEFMRGFLNATFKSNPWLERGLMTGITRVGKESMFSDLNNLKVFGVTTPKYMASFGFTEAEVFAAMDEYGLADRDGVKRMYDGFTIGTAKDIYNPWSVISYLQDPRLLPWWANTSSNAMVGELVRKGDAALKLQFMELLKGGTVESELDERIVFSELDTSADAVWNLLLSAGYLKPVRVNGETCELSLTNGEVRIAMEKLVGKWFSKVSSYGFFLSALLRGDLRSMNGYMNDVAEKCFSNFDTGSTSEIRGIKEAEGASVVPSRSAPERFYHGFVLGLLVELRGRYVIRSNRESGYGRYDVMLEPCDPLKDEAFIFEFKVMDASDGEKTMQDTVANALAQIEEKKYAAELIDRGIPAERIKRYGFAFQGKKVLIG